jgi:hypothetical protein
MKEEYEDLEFEVIEFDEKVVITYSQQFGSGPNETPIDG